MSGYCPDCGNTMCLCDETTKATYPYRCRIKELEEKPHILALALSDCKKYNGDTTKIDQIIREALAKINQK